MRQHASAVPDHGAVETLVREAAKAFLSGGVLTQGLDRPAQACPENGADQGGEQALAVGPVHLRSPLARRGHRADSAFPGP